MIDNVYLAVVILLAIAVALCLILAVLSMGIACLVHRVADWLLDRWWKL